MDALRLPDTRLVVEAEAVARAALPRALLNHSVRTFLLAQAYAKVARIDCDIEGLAVASLFHDLGLCEPYRDRRRPFTFNSSRAMVAFLDQHHVPAPRVAALVDAVDFHFELWPRWQAGPEAGLLHVGAYMDVLGARRGRIRADATRIDQHYSRQGLVTTFVSRALRSIGSPLSVVGLMLPTRCRRPHRPLPAP